VGEEGETGDGESVSGIGSGVRAVGEAVKRGTGAGVRVRDGGREEAGVREGEEERRL
jgi:hypothetical protein